MATSFGRYRTVNFCLMFMAYGALTLCRKSFSYLLPSIVIEETFTKSELGVIASSLMLAYCISKFFCGILSDRVRPHLFLTFGLIFVGLLNIQFANTRSVALFAVIWFLNGLCQGTGWPPCTKILKQWYHPSELGTWWSTLSASSNLAGMLGPLVMSVAADHLGWRYVMTIAGTLCMASSPLVFLFITNAPGDVGLPSINSSESAVTQENNRKKSDQNGFGHSENGIHPNAPENGLGSSTDGKKSVQNGVGRSQNGINAGTFKNSLELAEETLTNGFIANGTVTNGIQRRSGADTQNGTAGGNIERNGAVERSEEVNGRGNPEPTIADVVRSPFLWLISFTFFLVLLQSGAFQEWAQLLLIQDKGFSSAVGSGFTSAYHTGGFVGCITSGFITDRLVARNKSRRIGSGRIDYMLVVSICSLICQLCFLKLITPDTPWIIVTSCASCIGFCIYSCISLQGLLIVESSPTSLSGTAHAIGSLAGNVGAVSSGLPLSYISSLHDWSMTFTVVLVFAAVNSALLFLCNRIEPVIGRPTRTKHD